MDQLRLNADRAVPVPASPWLRTITAPDPGTPSRALLVLLPHAGGGAHAYTSWAPLLPAGVTLAATEYPGRGARMGEPALADLEVAVSELTALLADQPGRLYLGGHSLGALLAHEIAGRLAHLGRPVTGLFLSGSVPPHRRSGVPDLSLLDDDTLAAELAASGDVPAAILEDAEARELFLPIVRHDLELARRYQPAAGTGPPDRLRTRAVVVGGADDFRCPVTDLAAWADLVDGPTEVAVLPGGHFYHRDQLPAVGRLLGDLIDAPSPVG